MKSEQLISERNILRDKWRDVREKRLDIKKRIIAGDCASVELMNRVRHNAEYMKLKKEQRLISKMIKHIENKISREINNDSK
jgi:hypothetical protein